MPIYEYRCRSCGQEFEEWQKITEPSMQACRFCGGQASRLISQSTFVLKGTGWYATDYARKDGTTSPKPSTETKKPESTTSEPKKESSPSTDS